jgi:hypothetical protein
VAASLQRQRGDSLGRLLDRDVQAGGVLAEPAELGIGGRPAVAIVRQAMDRPVVDHLAGLVAPGRVVDLPDGEPGGVARDDAIHQPGGVRTGHLVLEERAHVDQGGRLADRVVLDVVLVRVDTRGEEARPLPPLLLAVERLGSGMERGSDAHADAAPVVRVGAEYA